MSPDPGNRQSQTRIRRMARQRSIIRHSRGHISTRFTQETTAIATIEVLYSLIPPCYKRVELEPEPDYTENIKKEASALLSGCRLDLLGSFPPEGNA